MLDTHAFIWMTTDDARLSKRARELILDSDNALFLSVASIWEMSIKFSLGKLTLNRPLAQIINDQVSTNGIRLLNIEPLHAMQVAEFPWHHRDPFDRVLAAQCTLEKLYLLSSDEILDAYGINRIW